MKLKKYIGLIVGACALVMFAGCYEPLEISDREMDMVAEYAAGVLVKHGTQTTDILLDREGQKDAFEAMATPTPRPTLPPASGEKDPSTEDTQSGEQGDSAATTPKPTATPVAENSDMTMKDLSALIGKDKFFFEYTDYEITTLYQGSGDLFAAAEEGKQLVVLKFNVTNQSTTGSTLVMNKGASKEFVYTLRVGDRTIRPSLTLLNEDFYTSYEAVYAPGETKCVVLVFECKKDMVFENAVLSVLRDVEGNEDSVLIKVK